MEKTHAVNIYIVPSVPSVGRETKGCLIGADVGWLALECAVRKAWDATFQSSCAGQGEPGWRTAVGCSTWRAQHAQRPGVGNHRMGKSASGAQ